MLTGPGTQSGLSRWNDIVIITSSAVLGPWAPQQREEGPGEGKICPHLPPSASYPSWGQSDVQGLGLLFAGPWGFSAS